MISFREDVIRPSCNANGLASGAGGADASAAVCSCWVMHACLPAQPLIHEHISSAAAEDAACTLTGVHPAFTLHCCVCSRPTDQQLAELEAALKHASHDCRDQRRTQEALRVERCQKALMGGAYTLEVVWLASGSAGVATRVSHRGGGSGGGGEKRGASDYGSEPLVEVLDDIELGRGEGQGAENRAKERRSEGEERRV